MVSGPKVAGYRISAAQRERIHELERRRRARRRWDLLRAERGWLRAEATALSRRYGLPAVTVPPLAEAAALDPVALDPVALDPVAVDRTPMNPAAVDPAELAEAIRLAEADNARLRERLVRLAIREREKVARSLLAGIAAAGKPDLAEVGRALDRLDPDIPITPQLTVLIAEIGAAAPVRRPALLERLLDRVRDLNTAARIRRDAAATLTELELLAPDRDEMLRAVVAVARAAHEDGQAIDTVALRRAADAADRRHTASLTRGYVLRTLVDAFTTLGYELAASPAPGGGLLLRRGPTDEPGVAVTVDETTITLTPVRQVDGTAFDRDVAAVWKKVGAAGIAISVRRRAVPAQRVGRNPALRVPAGTRTGARSEVGSDATRRPPAKPGY
jgi:hypothetical protein